MSQTNANQLHPKRWTVLTWLAIALWAWKPIVLNYPPSVSYSKDPATGKYSVPTHYNGLSEFKFPWGWPLYYVKPSYLTAPAVPMLAGTPVPPPVPSSVHPFALVTNLILVVITISSLVYILQKTRFRFSLLFLFAVMTAVPLYFALGRFIAMLAGYDAAGWYQIAIYFSPIPAALAVKFSIFPRVNWSYFLSIWTHRQQSIDEYANGEDAIAAALRLEMRGDWTGSIDLYRRAGERWPEHTTYVQNCIDRITKKQSFAQT